MSEVNDTQVGGTHYKTKYQHWDFVYDALGGRYLEGQLTKYIVRWRLKNGVEDVDKARHYHTKLMELFEAGKIKPLNPPLESPERSFALHSLQEFFQRNPVQKNERIVIYSLALWSSIEDLREIGRHLEDIKSEALRLAYEKAEALLGSVDHIDGDANNNDLGNLGVVSEEPDTSYVNQD